MGERSPERASVTHGKHGTYDNQALKGRQNMRLSFAPSGLTILNIWPTVGYARSYGARSPTSIIRRRFAACPSVQKAFIGGNVACCTLAVIISVSEGLPCFIGVCH